MLTTISPVSLLVAILAVWRVTHMLWGEDGPWDLFVRIRWLAGNGFLGSLLDCFYCLSLWTAAPPAWFLGHTWVERGVLWLAVSGGAILLERVTAERPQSETTAGPADKANTTTSPPPAVWHEDRLEG